MRPQATDLLVDGLLSIVIMIHETKSKSVLNELSNLRRSYDAIRRRNILWRIYTHSGWLFAPILWFVSFTGMTIWIVFLVTKSNVMALLGAFTVLIWGIVFQKAQRSSYPEAYAVIDAHLLWFKPQMEALRYVLFHNSVAGHWRGQRERLLALAALAQDRNDLVGSFFGVLSRNQIAAALLATIVILLNGLFGQEWVWSGRLGISLLVITAFALIIVWWASRALEGVFLTQGYRDREFCLFLRMLAEDVPESSATSRLD